jgi:hypothetical protein
MEYMPVKNPCAIMQEEQHWDERREGQGKEINLSVK